MHDNTTTSQDRSTSGWTAPARGPEGPVIDGPLRILVVEDDALIGELLREMLMGMGHFVCAIEATEAGAVAAAAQHNPQLMIVDATLAAGTGVGAVERILQRRPTPHLFMSGGSVTLGSREAIVLRKPFGEAQLAVAMQRALRQPAGLRAVGWP
jgi:CheY-like chemotaxis protein